MCKYGVVDKSRAVADIKDWETFYLSARLHKPVLELISDPEVTLCQRANLQRAVAVGLLTAPQTVSEEDLYLHISKLSYLGDPRLEAAGKLESMVNDNIAAYKEMYRPVFNTLRNAVEFEAGIVEVIRM
jgi:translocator assembly and maintenance protein 41